MKTIALIFLVFIGSTFAAPPVYEVVKVQKLLNDANQTERISLTIKVSIGADSEQGQSWIKSSDIAVADVDKAKIEEYAVDLAAQLQKRLEERLIKDKKVSVDPATILIDPVKVEDKKNTL